MEAGMLYEEWYSRFRLVLLAALGGRTANSLRSVLLLEVLLVLDFSKFLCFEDSMHFKTIKEHEKDEIAGGQ